VAVVGRKIHKRITPTEAELHASVAKFMAWAVLPPAFWTTFPAGWGVMPRSTAGRLKHCGLKPGMPDILVFHVKHVVGIELKTGRNGLTASQQETFMLLRTTGVHIHICRHIEDVIRALTQEDIPLRPMQQLGRTGYESGIDNDGTAWDNLYGGSPNSGPSPLPARIRT